MNKHTPGPWITTVSGFVRSISCKFDGIETVDIAHCYGMHNANLIAAAPELLEALETVSSSIETECELRGEDSSSNRYLLLCRAAIAKAKGL